MSIDEYLAELARVVPRGRSRFLEEAGCHLREAAAGHERRGLSREAAEVAAVRDFGPPRLVGRPLVVARARCALRSATVVVAGVAALFVVPLYAIPENTLPPAQWTQKPADIAALQATTVGLWVAAVLLGLGAAVAAWTAWTRVSAWLAVASALTIALSAAAGAALVVRWFAAAPATPKWPLLAAPVSLGCIGLGVAAALWAWSSQTRVLARD